jgi:hypothetical protein
MNPVGGEEEDIDKVEIAGYFFRSLETRKHENHEDHPQNAEDNQSY